LSEGWQWQEKETTVVSTHPGAGHSHSRARLPAPARACPRAHMSTFPKGLMKQLWSEQILQMHFSEKLFHLKSLNKARRQSKGF